MSLALIAATILSNWFMAFWNIYYKGLFSFEICLSFSLYMFPVFKEQPLQTTCNWYHTEAPFCDILFHFILEYLLQKIVLTLKFASRVRFCIFPMLKNNLHPDSSENFHSFLYSFDFCILIKGTACSDHGFLDTVGVVVS